MQLIIDIYYRLTGLQLRKTSPADAVPLRDERLAFRLRNNPWSQRRFVIRNKRMSTDFLAQQDLEEQLTSTVHSTALLKAKLEQETRLLEQSKLELDKLRKNTKREEVLRAKRSKAADHTISRGGTLALKESLNRKRPSNTNASRATVLTRSKTLNRGISTNFPHPNFPLLDQLHGHIESIEANYSQTKLIGEMIDNAGAKLASSL